MLLSRRHFQSTRGLTHFAFWNGLCPFYLHLTQQSYYQFAEFIHHCKPLRDHSGSWIKASKLPLFKPKVSILSMSSDLKCKGPSFAAGKFDISNPRVDVTSLTEGCGHSNRPWQVRMIVSILSEVGKTVIVRVYNKAQEGDSILWNKMTFHKRSFPANLVPRILSSTIFKVAARWEKNLFPRRAAILKIVGKALGKGFRGCIIHPEG